MEIASYLDKKKRVLELILKNKHYISKIQNHTRYITSIGNYKCSNIMFKGEKVFFVSDIKTPIKTSLPLEIIKVFVSFQTTCKKDIIDFSDLLTYLESINKKYLLTENDLDVLLLTLIYYYSFSLDGYSNFLMKKTKKQEGLKKAFLKTDMMLWVFNNIHVLENKLKTFQFDKRGK